jgi:hypothetical protein
MKELGWYRFADSDTWAVKAPSVSRKGFYMYGNDHRRGFDVYKFEPKTPASPGIWRTAEQQVQSMQAYKAKGGQLSLEAICLLSLGKDAGVGEAAKRAGFTLGR